MENRFTDNNPFLEVLNGRAVDPAPVMPSYGTGYPVFPPGLFMHRRLCELWHRRIQAAGVTEKTVTFDEALEVAFQAVSEVMDEVMPPPCCLSATRSLGMPSRRAVSGSRIRRMEDGFVWESANGATLLRAKRGTDGVWNPPPLAKPETALGNVDRDLARMRDALPKLKAAGPPRPNFRRELEAGHLDLIRAVKARYGGRVLVAHVPNAPLPQCYVHLRGPSSAELGYDSLLIALHSERALMRDLLAAFLPRLDEEWAVLRDIGVDAIFLGEYMSGADVLAPSLYKDVIAPYTLRQIEFFNEQGFKTVLVHGGSALPMLDILKEMPWHGLLVEESRKGYSNDIGEVRRRVGPARALLGNVDIALLESGSDEAVQAEVCRQVAVAGRDLPFILCTGSPITQATTPDRVRLFCDSASLVAQGLRRRRER